MHIPERPEEVTSDWLSDAFESRVDAVTWDYLGDGKGFMGDVLRMKLSSDDDNVPASLIAKLPQAANRTMGELLGVYEREIMFFRDFSSDLPVHAPRLFYSDFDRDSGSEKQKDILRTLDRSPRWLAGLIGRMGNVIAGRKQRRYVLLIEYFEGMEPGDQLAGLDLAACQQVLTAIAAMHRHYWNDNTLDDHFWLLNLDIDARLRQGMYRQHASRFQSSLPPEVGPALGWVEKHGESLIHRLMADAPSTLLHGDLRLDNVLFDGNQCGFIDFQMVRFGPAAYDVAYFISSALQADASAEDVTAALRAYHDALNIEDYSFEMLERDYARALLMILSGLASVEDVELANDRGNDMMQAWLSRLCARVQQSNWEEALA